MNESDKLSIDMNSCRICLTHKKFLYSLFNNKDVPTFGEMLTNCANVKVYFGDGLPDKICCICCRTLKSAYNLKQTAEKSDAVLQKRVNLRKQRTANENGNTAAKKMSFNTITDIKSELDALNLKPKPHLDVKIEILEPPKSSNHPNAEALNGKDIVICNTVIRKIEPNKTVKQEIMEEKEFEVDFSDEDYFQDDPHDEDYLPPLEDIKPEKSKEAEYAKIPQKTKFKISTLEDIKLGKSKKAENAKIPQKTKFKISTLEDVKEYKRTKEKKIGLIQGRQTSSYITYYPLLENGEKGPPVLLRRPKGKTISLGSYRPRRKEIPCKRPAPKPREKDCCPVCGVLTFTLSTHMLTHAEKKPFQCEHCPKSFVSKSCYEGHVKKHKGIKDHICEICGAAFYSKKNVVRHKLTHNGERPFACTMCSKTFVLNHALKRHLEIHAGYKPFKCTMCSMSFNASHQLRNHMIMHTGERPYSCKICELAFAYKVNLNNHVTRVHGINLRYKSIYTLTEEVLESELEAMSLAKKQANALLTMALEQKPQPVPDEQISTQIIFDAESSESY